MQFLVNNCVQNNRLRLGLGLGFELRSVNVLKLKEVSKQLSYPIQDGLWIGLCVGKSDCDGTSASPATNLSAHRCYQPQIGVKTGVCSVLRKNEH